MRTRLHARIHTNKRRKLKNPLEILYFFDQKKIERERETDRQTDTLTDRYGSVSYTHLDVYKRQQVSSVNDTIQKYRLEW